MRTAQRVLLAGVFLYPVSAAAQPGVIQDCPMSPSPAEAQIIRDRMLLGIYDAPSRRGQPDIFVPLTIHIIRRTDGTGGIGQTSIDLAIDGANAPWLGSGIQFCTPGATIFHDDDDLYSNTDTLAELNALRQLDQVQNTINVYFVSNLRIEIGSLCGISSFTTSSVDGIAVDYACLPHAGNPSTFPHELAHYFDLYHTHEPAFGTECTDGTNCLDAGDLVCDTPADPNVRGDVPPSTCVWNGSDTPTCGAAPYTPPTRNVLSYAPSTCRNELTTEQFARALATLTNLRPELIANGCDPCPNVADVNNDGVLDSTDFTAWITAFNTQDPAADQNADGNITPTDFSAWITNFNAGC
ncbi:MAG: hypothetical protein COB69_09195 [Phycisphaera sp.]|nr:MAG: hypothetical protein COB69_09195 [Phycisphaera sp.]